MKLITAIILLTGATDLFAQTDSVNGKIPAYHIYLTTVHENAVKGLMLQAGDSAVHIYPGERKDWKAKEPYKTVTFNYNQVRQISLKKNGGTLKGMLWGGGIGISVFAASALLHTGKAKGEVFRYTFPAIPLGIIAGAIIGNRPWKKFHINSDPGLYQSFKNKVQ